MLYGDARRAVVCAVRPWGSTMTGGSRVSLWVPGLTEAACSMTPGYGRARPGDVDAVLTGDRFG